jgi:hypothetical protein
MIEMEARLELGRARNALQEFFAHKLIFPKIYFDAEFNGKNVHVLAIDREGTGDVHAAYVIYQGDDVEGALQTIVANVKVSPTAAAVVPHFLYGVVVSHSTDAKKYVPPPEILRDSLAEDGVGRMGILSVDLSEDDVRSQVRTVLKAERFRSSKQLVEMADRFVAEHIANWEVRY